MPRRRTADDRRQSVKVPLSMGTELEAKVADTADRVKLSKQDVMRLALDRGLDVLLSQMVPADDAVGRPEHAGV